MSRPNDYGMLLNKNIKLHRTWFKQMTNLIGITCKYKAPVTNDFLTKNFDTYGDLNAQYPDNWINVGCIFQDHPDQKTLKKMGWVAELQEGSSIIHVPYDLEHLQVGCLFEVPSGLDDAKPRLFRVISMQNIMVYPASIACEIAPEYIDTDEKTLTRDFTKTNFTVLVDYEEDD
jgi:hypothetical protein